MGTSNCFFFSTWVIPKTGVPQNGWLIMENPINKWMIWGYHYFRKHPHLDLSFSGFQRFTQRSGPRSFGQPCAGKANAGVGWMDWEVPTNQPFRKGHFFPRGGLLGYLKRLNKKLKVLKRCVFLKLSWWMLMRIVCKYKKTRSWMVYCILILYHIQFRII